VLLTKYQHGNFISVECIYTIDLNAERPIMLIDRHIGYDQEDGEGIMGDRFSRELLFLDTLNKQSIEIWINSPGGSVTDGMQIYNTMLKTKTPVNTHNVGICASIALPLFLAGKKRYMMDNAVAMLHPVSGGDHKSREAFDSAVTTMLSSRSYIDEGKIKEMMNRTTWLTSKDCGPEGFNLCEVEQSMEYNKPRKTSNDFTETWKEFKNVVNKLIENKKPQKMSKVTNKLQLNESANEDAILAGIETIENRAKTAEVKLVTQETENKTKIEALNSELAAAKKAKEEAEKKIKEIEDKAKTETEATNKTRATDFVAAQVKIGRIANETDVINHWTEQLTSDFDKNKVVVEKLPINKVGPKVIDKIEVSDRKIPEGSEPPSIDLNNPQAYVARMNAKVYNNAQNRFK
jgi:ATP-dependent protease ClpP protease subunit